jgi:hypothetical protein
MAVWRTSDVELKDTVAKNECTQQRAETFKRHQDIRSLPYLRDTMKTAHISHIHLITLS